jgi:hypothetical protein
MMGYIKNVTGEFTYALTIIFFTTILAAILSLLLKETGRKAEA